MRVRAVLAAAALSVGGAAMLGAAKDARPDAPGGDALSRRATGPELPGACELAGADRTRTPSTRCAACHDGSVAPGVDFHMAPDGMSHPVEVDYGATFARRPDRYLPPQALPPETPLVAGRVACTSCHDGASPDPKRVAIPARLCQTCHRL